jgi:uncharacterized protein (DUF2062 family)
VPELPPTPSETPGSAEATVAARPRTFSSAGSSTPSSPSSTQGLTPEKIALTIAVGSSIAMFPLLGTTTLICLFVGMFMKLNQPIMQAVNYACTPIHLPFIYYSFRWGEWLFHREHSRLEMKVMRHLLTENPLQFVRDYSATALHAVFVWAMIIPFWGVAVFYIVRPILREIARAKAEKAAQAAAKSHVHPVP